MFCNVHGLTLVTVQLLCTYMLLIMIIMALLLLMVMLMGNDVTESDDSYDYYINTSDDDDDDDADYDEILTVECDNSVKINSNDRWLNNSVVIL